MGQLWGWGGCETGSNNGAAKTLGCYGALWEWGRGITMHLCDGGGGYRSVALWGSNGIWEGLWTPMGTVASGCLWGL